MSRLATALLLLFYLTGSTAFSQNPLDIIKGKWLFYENAENSLYNYLSAQAFDMLKNRSLTVASIHTQDEWIERQNYIQDVLSEIIGPFPEKTPLNARTVNSIQKPGYRIEHIIYESLPGFYVTSSLYIPEGVTGNNSAPAILYCSGHSAEGYRSAVYQHVILNLVRKGFVVFAFDPVGQGERLEYYDPVQGKSLVGGPTREHSYPGAQAFITGSSQAFYMIWDGIRAVDYLVARAEVDPSRIGVTGRSGGGTQSAYIAAVDERIYAAAPENYITNYTRLLQSIGPQDAEQNLFNLISRGLDHPDFLIVRAPKPALLITTTEDMFSIQGSIETEREVALVYRALGKEENFSRVQDDAGHASTKKNREAMYAFFRKHLRNPGSTEDVEIPIPEPDELRVTETGQISTSLKSETVFSLNRKSAVLQENKLDSLRNRSGVFYNSAVNSAKKLSGYLEPSHIEEPVLEGRVVRGSYMIDKYFLKGEGNYVIPFLLFRPEIPTAKYLIYLHPSGKSADAESGGDIERFVRAGYTVLAPDMLGKGETGPGTFKGDASFDGVSHNIWYASMLIGRSITGIQAGDLARLILLIKKFDSDAVISGLAKEEAASLLLHAAAFIPEIKSVVLIRPYSSFSSIVLNRFYQHRFIPTTVPGALKEYDLPDLAASLAPRKMIISDMTDGNGRDEDGAGIVRDLEIIRSGYRDKNASDRLMILQDSPIESIFEILDMNK